MRQFFAILKDSFREAVDGFVVYAMLGISALLIGVAATMSFTPVAPEKAFDTIVQQFNMVFPEKGRSRVFTGSSDKYDASDVRPSGSGYQLRLTVTGQGQGTITDSKGTRPVLDQGDSFRRTVASWAKPAGKTIKVDPSKFDDKDGKKDVRRDGDQGGGRSFEVGFQSATPEEQKAVTSELMEEFIQSQFYMLAGMDVTAKRVTDGVAEPVYAFDVTTTGGSAVKGWPHATKIFFGAFTLDDESPLGATLWGIEDVIINRIGGAFALLIGLIITAFFIPNMLRKGSVDLLISKPIGRSRLLVYKYIGGLTFMFLVSAFTVGGIWFVLAARSGYWNPGFLMAIPLLTFTFAILYAISTLAAVFTRSAVAAMLLSIGFAFFMFVFGQIKTNYDDARARNPDRPRPAWQAFVVDNGHDVLPRTREIEVMIRRFISQGALPPAIEREAVSASGDPPSPVGTFGVSLVHIAWMLGLSCWWFIRRDY